MTKEMNIALRKHLNKVQLIVLDVDGVLTDGAIIYAGDKIDVKSFNAQDGFGIAMAKQSGLKLAILTGRVADSVQRRVDELEFDYYESGHFHKQEALQNIMQQAGVSKKQVLYMGDDILDLACYPLVGVFVAPANAVERVKHTAHWVTQKAGGDTAVREMIDGLLFAQGKLEKIQNSFL